MTILLADALTATQALLQALALGTEFDATFALAFGDAYDDAAAAVLRQQWQAADFTDLPQIEVRPSADLPGALGAYAAATDTIYLSQGLLASAPLERVAAVLLEEIGHGVEQRLRPTDMTGDEGQLFSALVRGVELSAA